MPRHLLLSCCVALALGGCAPLAIDGSDEPSMDDALTGLGGGDEVLTASGDVKTVYKSTARGIVAAALTELHRGEDRTLNDILADTTATRVLRGPLAAIEKPGVDAKGEPEGSNWDDVGAQKIASRVVSGRRRSMGPIETYLRAVDIGVPAPWCGAFATFVHHRAGIRIPSLALARSAPNVIASSGGSYFRVTGPEVREVEEDDTSPVTYTGSLERGRPGESQSYGGSAFSSLLDLDIRPGDLAWWEHVDGTGHLGVVIGVHQTADEIAFVTIEGNKNDRVNTHIRRITRSGGSIVSNVKGWGRVAQVAAAPVADDPTLLSPWMRTALSSIEDDVGGDR